MLGTDTVVGGNGQDVSHTVPGCGKPHPNKTAPSRMALPAQSFLTSTIPAFSAANGSGSFAVMETTKTS